LKLGTRNFQAVLAAGALAMLLPSAVALLAADKVSAKPATTAPAAAAKSPPASAPAKTKEQKEAEEIARVMDFFKRTQPDVYEQALQLRATDPDKFKSLVQSQSVVCRVNSLEDIKKNDPEYYDLKIKDYQFIFLSKRLAEQLHRSDLTPADRAKIMADLNDLISREFDNAQQMHRKEIANIEERVKKLQATLEEREQNKDKYLKRRLNELAPPPPATAPAAGQKNP